LLRLPTDIVGAVVDQEWENTSQGSAAIPTLERRHAMQTRRFTQLPGLALAVLLTLLVGSAAADNSKLAGTWNVTVRFPVCDAICTCPGGVPNIPIPGLHQYQQHGALLEIGSSVFRGPGVGSWERVGDKHFVARYKFFLFSPTNLSCIGSEEVTNDIRLTGPDAFEATATFDLFDAAGNMTAQGCLINGTATRFE
jgi:hypothetical protein